MMILSQSWRFLDREDCDVFSYFEILLFRKFEVQIDVSCTLQNSLSHGFITDFLQFTIVLSFHIGLLFWALVYYGP